MLPELGWEVIEEVPEAAADMAILMSIDAKCFVGISTLSTM